MSRGPSLVVSRPCPIPSEVVGDDCGHCGRRVHDLRRSIDPAADLARLGGRACVRVLASALVLGGCSGAADLQPTLQIAPITSVDAGDDAAAAPAIDPEGFLGEMVSQ